uniref:Uncharacterized protein n=1 Tax=Plectus sambesii TaxID=2011161 RepID=A0A914V8V2_9BILA
MRSRLPVAQFANMACTIVRHWSQIRNPEAVNFVPFDSEAPVKEKDNEEAYGLIREKRKMLTQRSDGVITTFIANKGLINLTSEQVRAYKQRFHENHWPSFDTYVEMGVLMWAVSIPMEN